MLCLQQGCFLVAWVMQHRSGNQDTAVLFPAALLWAGYVLAQGISQQRLGLLLKVILTDGDLRAGQLQPNGACSWNSFPGCPVAPGELSSGGNCHHLNMHKYNLLCLTGLSSSGAALRAAVL